MNGGYRKIEILRVIILRSLNSHWVVLHCPDKGTSGRLWKEYDILRIRRVRKVLNEKFKLCGINKAKDLQNLPNERFSE